MIYEHRILLIHRTRLTDDDTTRLLQTMGRGGYRIVAVLPAMEHFAVFFEKAAMPSGVV